MKNLLLMICALSSLSAFANYNCAVKIVTERNFLSDKEQIALAFSTTENGSTEIGTTNVLELKSQDGYKYMFWFEGETMCNSADCSLEATLKSTYNDADNNFVGHASFQKKISIKINQERKFIVATKGNKTKSITIDCSN
ncbi:hypothetical protein M899_2250 [Bacteriovorax sp. BSW11_IV]|uniref:hypothetical protein n=1 Tax=Bacteriovorax sp. BSW11_IV TaxID=1353529 RepID=UPI000389FAC7|nr:hypothetical protein [Bacteriovorax sp. BSW11_IV]EQC44095.1 hypothetical protein M899_2250 [Bacteriovorax sp. BSW11_IV]